MGVSRPAELPNYQIKVQDSKSLVFICGSDIPTIHRKGTKESIIEWYNKKTPLRCLFHPRPWSDRQVTWLLQDIPMSEEASLSRTQVHLLPWLRPSPPHHATLVKTQLHFAISFDHWQSFIKIPKTNVLEIRLAEINASVSSTWAQQYFKSLRVLLERHQDSQSFCNAMFPAWPFATRDTIQGYPCGLNYVYI